MISAMAAWSVRPCSRSRGRVGPVSSPALTEILTEIIGARSIQSEGRNMADLRDVVSAGLEATIGLASVADGGQCRP